MPIGKTRVAKVTIKDELMEQEEFTSIVDVGEGNVLRAVNHAMLQFFVREDVLKRLSEDSEIKLSVTVK